MINKKKNLILVCNKFPYGFGETFLEAEFPFLHKTFRKIIIVTTTEDTTQTRTVPKDVVLLRKPREKTFFEILKTIWYIVTYSKTFINLLCKELRTHKSITRNNPELNSTNRLRIIIPILDYAFRAFNLKLFLEKQALPLVRTDSVLYSYWQDYAALSLALIKKENPMFKAICRAHRVDLYFDASKYNYLPFRKVLSEYLDKIIFISEDGLNYQNKLLNKTYSNYIVSYLGTIKLQEVSIKKVENKYILVSCSTLTPVKRVHLIIEALAIISKKEIHWVHFGDGKLKDALLLLAKEKLDEKPNISYTFQGNVKNAEIHNFYTKNQVSMFINVSESEGIPVSIMEATSYGIPVIATNVGGTSELVNNKCGILLEKDFDTIELASILSRELNLENLNKKGLKALSQWHKQYNAIVNFTNFVTQI